MKTFKGTPGRWTLGIPGTVVSDTPSVQMIKYSSSRTCYSTGGYTDTDYYGGYLIAESIFTKDDAEVIALVPEMTQTIIDLVDLFEDIDKTLFHHNHNIEGYHLNGDLEPIMNFVSNFDMEKVNKARQLIGKIAK